METTITITTINKPTFIEGLCKNLNTFGYKDTDIVIIGDVKTPPLEDYLYSVNKEYGIPIDYLTIETQEARIPKVLCDMFDYNTPDRTMLGGMYAYLNGAKRVIALDDDNYITESDFAGWHKVTGLTKLTPIIQSDSGWFNVHECLDSSGNVKFYPRGYPFGQRHKEYKVTQSLKEVRIVVNQGLVLGDPDIDAIQRLAHPINAYQMNNKYPMQFGLYKTWSPFNYQNTSIFRDLIPCYFRPKSALRNGDIWTAYIFNRLADHMGDVITFGHPLVNQVRNKHDLFDDLDIELQNNKEADYFCNALQRTTLTKTSYFEALNELVNKVEIDDTHPMSKKFFEEYKQWLTAVATVL